jgi:hypothetical protein
VIGQVCVAQACALSGTSRLNPVNELAFAFAGHDLYDGRRIPSNRAKMVALQRLLPVLLTMTKRHRSMCR